MAEHVDRDQTEHIRGKLVEQLQTLKLLEHELRTRAGTSIQARMRPDTVLAAITSIELAVSSLDMVAIAEGDDERG